MAAPNRIYIQVDFQSGAAISNVNKLNAAVAGIGPTTQKATQQASQGVNSLSLTVQQAQRSFAGIGASVAGLGLARAGGEAIQVAADIDTLRKTLALWEGSQEKANARFDQFRQLAQQPGLSLEPMIKSYSRLMSTIEDSDKSIEIITGFGKALGQMGRGGDDLTGVLEQVTQSLSKGGNLMREDLKFIQQYTPQVTKILKELYGTADTEKLAKKGINAAEAWTKITERLNALAGATPGIQKQLDLFWQEMRLGAEQVGMTLAKELKPAMDEVVKGVKDLIQWWKDLDDDTKTLIINLAKLTAGLGLVGAAVWALVTAVGALGTAFTTLMANPVALTLLGIGTAVGAVTLSYREMKKALDAVSESQDAMIRRQQVTAMMNRGANPLELVGKKDASGRTWTKEDIQQALGGKSEYGFKYEGGDTAAGYKLKKDEVPARKELTEEELEKAAKKAAKLKEFLEDARRKSTQALQETMADLNKAIRNNPVEAQFKKIGIDLKKEFENLQDSFADKGLTVPQDILDQFKVRHIAAFAALQREVRNEVMKTNREALREIAEGVVKDLQERTRDINEKRGENYQEWLNKERDFLQEAQQMEWQYQLETIERSKELQLAALEETGNETLSQKLAMNAKRLEIENDYVTKSLELNLKLLALDKERALFQLEAERRKAGMLEDDPQYQRAKQALEAQYELRSKGMTDAAADKREANRLKTITDQAKIIRSEMKETYDYFSRMAEGVFDALLTKSKSVTQSMADFFKTTFLTMIKSLYTQIIATTLTSAMYGRSAGGMSPGGSKGGLLNVFGGLFGGGGGGGGGTHGFPGTPPFIPGNAGGGGGGGGILGGLFGGRGGGGGYSDMFSRFGGGGTGGGKGLAGFLGKVPLLGGLFGGGGGGAKGPLGIPGGDMGNYVGDLFGTGKVPKGVGGLKGDLLMGGGATLAMMGLQRGGWSGVGMTTAGGAMIGAKFGGPIGAAIGAGVGFGAGMIRKFFFKDATKKVQEKVRQIYGIDIQSKQILQQIVDIGKSQYGGDMNVALYSPQVREIIEMYAATQGTSAQNMPRQMHAVTWGMSGGSASLQDVYKNGQLVNNPYTGPTSVGPQAQQSVFVQLNPVQAQDLLTGHVLKVVGDNPNEVADSASSAGDAQYRRSAQQSSLLEPATLMA